MNPSRKFRTWTNCHVCRVPHDGLHLATCYVGKMEDEIDRLSVSNEQILKAQEHAIDCGNLALELQSALALITSICTQAGWPKTAEQMAPMNMARVALKKKLPDTRTK